MVGSRHTGIDGDVHQSLTQLSFAQANPLRRFQMQLQLAVTPQCRQHGQRDHAALAAAEIAIAPQLAPGQPCDHVLKGLVECGGATAGAGNVSRPQNLLADLQSAGVACAILAAIIARASKALQQTWREHRRLFHRRYMADGIEQLKRRSIAFVAQGLEHGRWCRHVITAAKQPDWYTGWAQLATKIGAAEQLAQAGVAGTIGTRQLRLPTGLQRRLRAQRRRRKPARYEFGGHGAQPFGTYARGSSLPEVSGSNDGAGIGQGK